MFGAGASDHAALASFQSFVGPAAPANDSSVEVDQGWVKVSFGGQGLKIEDWHGFWPRHKELKPVIMAAHKRLPRICQGSFMVYTGDRPPADAPGAAYYSSSVTLQNAQARGFPDYHFGDGLEGSIAAMRHAAAAPPSDLRVFWKGSVHAGTLRESLVQLAAAESALFDVHPMNWSAPDPGFIPLEAHCKYAALIDIEGNRYGYSGRIKELLHCGRPMLLQDRRHWDWPLHLLQPWAHDVPVADDLSDLVAKVRWLRGNPAVAARVGAAGAAFAAKLCTRRAAEDRILELMMRECS